MFKRLGVLLVVVMLGACATTPQTQEIKAQNELLMGQLEDANRRVAELESDLRLRQQDIDELNRVLGVLDTEKSSRVQESSQLRGQVRRFMQQQIETLRQFLVTSELLDYIGGELVERSNLEDRSMLLVDLGNPVPRNGALTGVGVYLSEATPFQVKILRPIDNNMVVIWESQMITPTSTGLHHFEFPVTVGFEQGDYMAYYFPETVGVSFNEGTGDVRYLTSDLRLGSTTRKSSLSGEDRKRSYSIGVYGLLN